MSCISAVFPFWHKYSIRERKDVLANTFPSRSSKVLMGFRLAEVSSNTMLPFKCLHAKTHGNCRCKYTVSVADSGVEQCDCCGVMLPSWKRKKYPKDWQCFQFSFSASFGFLWSPTHWVLRRNWIRTALWLCNKKNNLKNWALKFLTVDEC